MSSSLTIVTRMSPLALWQAKHIEQQLKSYHLHLTIDLKGIKTQGDRWLDQPLYELGGKSVFVKELEQALLTREADIAVHSLKDMPVDLPSGLILGAIAERENPLDAWICPVGHSLTTLPSGSIVGTSSLRRQMQLGIHRPDLEYRSLRGNVETRVKKCLAGEFDAIVLAVAGLLRLGLQEHITTIFEKDFLLPAVGQGALGIECRENDQRVKELLAPLNHSRTQACVLAERAMNRVLGGNCQVPIAGYAEWKEETLYLIGRVGKLSPYVMIEAEEQQSSDRDSEQLGKQIAQRLIEKGAKEYLS